MYNTAANCRFRGLTNTRDGTSVKCSIGQADKSIFLYKRITTKNNVSVPDTVVLFDQCAIPD